MPLKQFTINFREFSQESLMRSNYKTAIFGIEIKNHIKQSDKQFVRLKDFFDIISGFAFKSEDYEQEGMPLIRIGDVGNDFDENNMVFLPEDYKDDYSKFLLKKNDIIVSLTGEGKLKSDIIEEGNKYLLNQRVGSLRAKKDINILFYFYLLNYFSLIKKQFYWWSNGKTQLNISPFDFLKIKIPLIPKSTQDKIVAQIEPIEKKIKELKSQITPPQEVINKVFAREFKFDLRKFEKLEREKLFQVEFFTIGKQNDLRFSAKHSLYSQYLNEIVKKHIFLNFGKILSKKPQYGANESAKDFSEGDIRYIRITDIDNTGNLLNDDIKTADNIEEKYLLKNNDFLFARSGNTVGKSFLYNQKIHGEAIFAGYFIKFVFDHSIINSLFLLYYSKSFIFEIWKNTVMRTMGQPNINAEEYKTLPIPNISLKHQQKIVDEIKAELDKQEEMKQKIETQRNKIDEIIENVIK